jgi:hypothetical protein
MTKEFFSHGKYFDSFEEMMEYCKGFGSLPCDTDYFQNFLDDRFTEILINKQMNPLFTNNDAFDLLSLSIYKKEIGKCEESENK